MAIINIKSFLPTRAIIWIMLFTCTFFLYMIRINLSIIILAMVEPKKGNITVTAECLREVTPANISDHVIIESKVSNYGEQYKWDSNLQGLILGSYFWGFFLTGIPGGILAGRFGPTRCITISFIVSGVLTLVGPWAAAIHPVVLIISRFLIGAVGGVVFPSLHFLVSRWAPPDEKGKFIGALLGGSLGTMITWPMLGAIIESFGWTWAFLSCGIFVICWTVLWFYLVADSPEVHPRISEEEKAYITDSLSGNIAKEKRQPPYKKMACSVPFWTLIILHFGNLWGLFFLMTAGPNFLSSVLGFTLGHTGFLAALPYFARLIFGFLFGQLGDLIIRKSWMNKTMIRKSFVLFSHILPGVLLFVQTLTGCDVTWAIVLITLSLGSNGASTLTNLQNSQDLAPNFAGIIYGIANCIGSTTGFISPAIVGYLTEKHNGLNEWHTIFYIGSSVYIGCGIIFCIFGSGDVQPWNDIVSTEKKEVDGIENIAFDSFETKKDMEVSNKV
ncbi:sialin [Leptinotarsa decemlineata]|uniref:sialin n=1 Tax=Leptinotarsa decemlineata TaxID=7539 RepID=UPI003D30C7A3